MGQCRWQASKPTGHLMGWTVSNRGLAETSPDQLAGCRYLSYAASTPVHWHAPSQSLTRCLQ
ncbi:hypothetical protein CRENPOLYSF1_800007 [Crenothrix polyspora]|uniref:Uncharacterized protein n=1 Tax=Crenothrix polyspora TaxID=360316 RepID=A0A1R4HI77_9GAMM|nr:hypothetical protein CRENPOLYSF1_800007 [Crenothrix polyspora]